MSFSGSFMIGEINPDLFSPDEGSGGGNKDKNQDNSENLTEFGELNLPKQANNIHVLTIVGQIEGHLEMPPQNKATKYEHIITQLVAVEQNEQIEGLIVILNTVGGDVEAGLAIAEMIASLSKPTVSLVLGGGHSIGVPVAVATDKSYIAPTATMTIHPIRLTGLVLGVQQSFDYLERMQERVIHFVTAHSQISAEKFRELMMATGQLARDVGTILVGEDAVQCGLVNEIGGLDKALDYLRNRIKEEKPVRKTARKNTKQEKKKAAPKKEG